MKKIILAVAIAGLALSCKKIQAGSNKGVLKMEENSGRYSDDVMSDEATAKVSEMQDAKMKSATDTSKVAVMQTPTVKMDSAKTAAPTSEMKKTEVK